MSLNAMNDTIPYIERLVDLKALLAQKSHFILGPRQTGKTFLIRHTLENVRIYAVSSPKLSVAA